MNTKLLLGASAIVLGAAGIAGTFAPHELAAALGLTIAGPLPLLVQLMAALLFGFAMVNWMARGSLIGGIYNRPLLVGNVAHFVIGALAAGKTVLAGEHRPAVIAIAAVYAIFAAGFGMLLFRSPVSSPA
ncbi:MAG TPA: hypothetical protein VHW00_13590 [Thermoanaerobaculia bacterium]|nr:hypothetical protein [Thermoanaerobaculia bacterium]